MKGIISLLILLRTLGTTVLAFIGATIIVLQVVDYYGHLPSGAGGVGFYGFMLFLFLPLIAISIGLIRYSLYVNKRNSGAPTTTINSSIKLMLLDVLKSLVWALLITVGGFVLLLNSTQLSYYGFDSVPLMIFVAVMYTTVSKYKALTEIFKLISGKQ